jgi:hypothetical protein
MSLFVAIFDISIQSDFEFVMILIVGSTNDKFLHMRKLAFDRIEP